MLLKPRAVTRLSMAHGSVVVRALDLQSTGRGFDYWPAVLSSSDPGQVVHTCPAPLKLRPHSAIEI